MSDEPDVRPRTILWYRVKAAMLRREALRPSNFRARTVLLYNASRYEWLADNAENDPFIGTLEFVPKPTIH
jgi:hypothetical protein